MATNFAQAPEIDPFDDYDKVPSLSFADAAPGVVYEGLLVKLPREVHERDFGTKELKYWKDGSPQMAVVLHLEVRLANGATETRSVWAKKPSSMFRALGEAQKVSGHKFMLGGTLAVRFTRTEPSKTPGFSPQKIYEARYTPPVVVDPWEKDQRPASAPAAQAAPSVTPQAPAPQAALPGIPTPASRW